MLSKTKNKQIKTTTTTITLQLLFMDGVQLSQRVEQLTGESLFFATKSPGVSDTHLIDNGGMKGWVDVEAYQILNHLLICLIEIVKNIQLSYIMIIMFYLKEKIWKVL